MPFLLAQSRWKAKSHLFSGTCESSKIVPTMTVNCFRHARHFQMARATGSFEREAGGWTTSTSFTISSSSFLGISATLALYALAANRARTLLRSTRAIRLVNRAAGGLMASAALAVATLGAAWWWLYRRWRHPVTWLAGVAPFLAVLFVFYVYLERLLPANF